MNLIGTSYNHLLCMKHSKLELGRNFPCDPCGVLDVISLVVTNCRWILVVIRVARPHLRRGLFREFFTGLISGEQFAWIM